MTMSMLNRQHRTAIAVMGKLWAYYAALSRGDWTAASTILTSFQRDWEVVRPIALTELDAETRARVDRIVPRALSATGQWSVDVKNAAGVLIFATLGDQAYAVSYPTMPEVAGGIGAWFTSTLRPLFPAGSEVGDVLWRFDAEVRADESHNAGLVVDGVAMELIEQVSVGPAVPRTGASIVDRTSSSTTPANLIDEMTRGSGASFLITSPPDDEPTMLAETRVVGRRVETSGWTLLIGAAGLATLGGLIVWMLAYRRRPRSSGGSALTRRVVQF